MLATLLARLVASLAAVAAVHAQTFVVDINNGPGTDFTSMQAAVAAVPDGATLIVRPGAYSPPPQVVTVQAKGLTILGEPVGSAVVTVGLTISGQNASQRVVLKDLFFMAPLQLQSCLGPVHVEDCKGGVTGLVVDQCPQVSVSRCFFGIEAVASTFTQSNVTCVDSTFSRFFTTNTTATVLTINGGTTQLARCGLAACPAGYFKAGGNAIEMTGGTLRLLGPGSVLAGSTSLMAIGGTGTVRMGPNISRRGTVIPYTTIDEGTTSTTAAPLGGVVTGTLEGSANLFGGLVFGFPQAPATLPGITEELWVNPLGFAISGSLATPLTFWLDVPADPGLRGWMLGWQGVTFGAAGAVLANPAWFCID